MKLGAYQVAHTLPRQKNRWVIGVYRTHQRASLATAVKKAAQIRRAGYLAWVEKTGEMATR